MMKYAVRLFLASTVITIALFYSQAFAGGIGWEAEDAVAINPPLQVFAEPKVSNGEYITSPTSNQGSAEYEFEVPVAGTYFMWAHHLSTSSGMNSYHLVIDEPKKPADDSLVWDTVLEPQPKKLGEVVDIENKDSYSNDWGWIRVFGRDNAKWNMLMIRTFDLKTGKHKMYLWTRERETKVDCFYLADRFDEQPVFPDEAPGLLAVDPTEKVAITWGGVKEGYRMR